jgi:hypothetical protein
MNRGVRALGVSLVIGVVGAVAPAAANALVLSFSPSSLNFGTHQYGTQTSLTTTFTVTCNSPPGPDCAPQGSYSPNGLQVSPDSFTQSNDCDEPMEPSFGMPASCTVTVTFSPLANGAINGLVRDVGGQATLAVSGTGFGVPTSSSPGSPASTTTKCKAKKKKKKKHSAKAAKKKKKKCKKKKNKKKK